MQVSCKSHFYFQADIPAPDADSQSPGDKQASPSVTKDVNKSWREVSSESVFYRCLCEC